MRKYTVLCNTGSTVFQDTELQGIHVFDINHASGIVTVYRGVTLNGMEFQLKTPQKVVAVFSPDNWLSIEVEDT